MPIDSHEDIFSLAAMEKDIGKLYKAIANQENRINSIRDKLAAEYDGMIRFKREVIRIFNEIIKKIEDLDRSRGAESLVDKSKIDLEDVKLYKEWIAELEKDIEKHSAFSDSLKSLSFQVNNTIDKLFQFGQGFENLGDARNKFTKADKVLAEKKDKLMKPEKIGAMESNKEEASRYFDQVKKDILRRRDEYLKELEKTINLINEAAEKMKL
ncbi:MAG: hypothetical protein ACTSWN_02225 [Promethearchaeota archaeon]